MIPKKACPALDAGGHLFSEKIMLQHYNRILSA